MSETKKCRECHSEIPKKAKRCSGCSAEQGSWMRRHPFISFLIIIIVIPVIVSNSVSNARDKAEQARIETNNKAIEQVISTDTIDIDKVISTHTIDTTELKYMSSKDINVFNSYSNRKVVFKLNGTETVELLKKDEVNNYCKVRYSGKSGWLNCGWLK